MENRTIAKVKGSEMDGVEKFSDWNSNLCSMHYNVAADACFANLHGSRFEEGKTGFAGRPSALQALQLRPDTRKPLPGRIPSLLWTLGFLAVRVHQMDVAWCTSTSYYCYVILLPCYKSWPSSELLSSASFKSKYFYGAFIEKLCYLSFSS